MRTFTGHLPGTRAYQRLLVGMFFAGIATFAQLYSTQAVLPSIAAEFDASAADVALTVSATTLGVAGAVLGWSAVADRIGRTRAMAIGIVAATTLALLAPLAPTLGALIAVRLGEGIALGAVPAIALAYLAEEVAPEHTASAAGSYIAGTTIGGLVGRLVTGPFGDIEQWRLGVFAAALVCALSATLFLRLTPPAQGFTQRATRGIGHAIAVNLRDRHQISIYLQGFLLMGGFVAVFNYLGFRLTAAPFHLPAWLVSLLFLAYLAGSVSSPWAGRAARRFGRRPALFVSLALTAAGAALTVVDPLPLVLIGLLVFTAGFFGAHTVLSSWAPASARPEARAQAASLYYLGYYGGSSLFGWALGLPFAALGWPAVAWGVTGMVVLAAAASLLLRRAPASHPA